MNSLKLSLYFSILVISVAHGDISQDYKNIATKERLGKIIKSMNRITKSLQVKEMNKFLDNLLDRVNGFIEDEYDSKHKLPEILNYTFHWGLEMSGKLSLTDMWITGLSTLTREGDVGIERTDGKLIYHFPIKYENIKYQGKYNSKVMQVNRGGKLEGKVKRTHLMIAVQIDLITLRADVRDLEEHGSWKITTDFSGILGDFVLIVSNEVKDILTPSIKSTMHDFTLNNILPILYAWNQD